MKKIELLILIVFGIFVLSISTLAWTKISPVPLVTNSPYKNGVNNGCGGCPGLQSCQPTPDPNNPSFLLCVRLADGQTCMQASDCTGGFCNSNYCSAIAPQGTGVACTQPYNCISGVCAGTCAAPSPSPTPSPSPIPTPSPSASP